MSELQDGEAVVEESVGLEAAGWWSGAAGRRSCGMVGAARWWRLRDGFGWLWLGEMEDWGIWWHCCLQDPGGGLYMELQYYQNILIVSFAGCSGLQAGGA
jgi:hypothetical protein